MDWNRYRFMQTLVAIAALFIVVGLMTLAAGAAENRAAAAIDEWPSAEGTITAAETVWAERRGRSITYVDAVRLAYSYRVDGAVYLNDRIGANTQPVLADSAAGRDLFARFPPGAIVPVYYNPADPADSVLVRGQTSPAARNGAALAVLGAAVLALYWLLRRLNFAREAK